MPPAKQPRNKKRLFTNIQWQQCYNHFLQSIYDLSSSDVSVYTNDRILRRFFTDPKKTPNQYTQNDVREFIHRADGRWKTVKPPAPNTRNTRLNVLKSFYSFAAKYYVPYRGSQRPILHVNPTSGIRTAQAPQTHRTLSKNELKRFFSVIPTDTLKGKRDRALFLCYLWTGRRQSEVITLKWGDLQPGYRFADGHVGCIYRFVQKGHVGEEGAELPLPAWQAIEAYLIAAGRRDTIQPEDPIFQPFVSKTYEEVHKPLSARVVQVLFHRYATQAGIARTHVGVHAFRHTAAQAHYKQDRDLVRCMRFLGHRNAQTSLTYLEGLVYEPDLGANKLYAEYGDL